MTTPWSIWACNVLLPRSRAALVREAVAAAAVGVAAQGVQGPALVQRARDAAVLRSGPASVYLAVVTRETLWQFPLADPELVPFAANTGVLLAQVPPVVVLVHPLRPLSC